MHKLPSHTTRKTLFLALILLQLTFILYMIFEFPPPSADVYSSPEESIETELMELSSKCQCLDNEKILITKTNKHYSAYFTDNVLKTTRELFTMSKNDFETARHTCDTFNVFKRGLSQKIIGYSLYGLKERYYEKLADIVKLAGQFYPGWTIRVYHDSSIDTSVICEFQCRDIVDFCDVENVYLSFLEQWAGSAAVDLRYVHGMMWRWLPLGDSFVDFFMSRDLDSFIIQREVDSVNCWLGSSDKLFHIMRDHPLHSLAIMGGMWGIKTSMNRSVSNYFFEAIVDKELARSLPGSKGINKKSLDKRFLCERVHDLVKEVAVVHDSYWCERLGGGPWPTQRRGDCFVGSSGNCSESAGLRFKDFRDCPLQCRPLEHPNWKKC